MQLDSAVAVVTGANRGLGRELARQLRDRGAKVYAAARDQKRVDLDGVTPLQLDITDPASVRAAADRAADATVLINNAGIATGTDVLDGELDGLRQEFETHVLGTLQVTRAFVPVIESNGGGAILNVLSVLSWIHLPDLGGYVPAKAAEWALTNQLRQKLQPRSITVSGLHVGYMDTDMTAGVTAPKLAPAAVAATALDAIAAGEFEVLAD